MERIRTYHVTFVNMLRSSPEVNQNLPMRTQMYRVGTFSCLHKHFSSAFIAIIPYAHPEFRLQTECESVHPQDIALLCAFGNKLF